MSFTEPTALVLLVVPVLLLVWAWQRRSSGLALPFDDQAHAPRRFLGWMLSTFDSMPAIILLAVVFMLAGPQVLRRPSDQRVLTNIQFCVDVSGSMTIGNRYEMAIDAVEDFIDARQGDAFGLTLFGSYAIRWVPLTRDLDAIRNALPFADPQRQPMHMGGTRIGHALQFCLGNIAAEAEAGDRMIVLVSDGMSSDISDASASLALADDLKASNIAVFHVHVGTGSVPGTVQELARETGGEAFVATDRKGLDRAFRYIDQLRPDRFEPGGTVPMDFFMPFALVALSALGLHVIGLFGGRYTPW
ncbi:MAG: VWA domain-containing protein [Phycisphaerales bacterium]|nr:VWA domain-containing protein [Phycisphaerales bacterium]